MRGIIVAAIAALASGCTFATMSTRTATTFGYRQERIVAMATSGEPDVVEAWRIGATAADVIHEELPAAPDADLCTAARARPKPIDEVIVAALSAKSEDKTECVKTECHVKDPVGQGSSGDPVCDCVKTRYVGTTSTATAEVRVLDTATCTVRRELTLTTHPFMSAGSTNEAGKHYSQIAMLDHLKQDATRETRNLFIVGPEVVRQDGRRIEVEHDGDPALVPGAVYYLRGRLPTTTNGPRVVVRAADRAHATLEADTPPAAVELGDQLRRKTIDHRWTAFPSVHGGRTDGNHGLAGVAITGRWSSGQIPLMAEARLAAEMIPGFDTDRYSGGVGAGVRWPLGPVNPIGLVEAGLEKWNQGAGTTEAGYVGVGAGVEVWIGKLALFAEVRQRWQRGEAWHDGSEMPVTVEHPATDFAMTIVQIGVGWRAPLK